MKKVQFGQTTDVGSVRDHNEDNLLSMVEQGLWLVADGMGGYEAGEVASAIVVEEASRLFAKGLNLGEVLAETHRRIHEAVKQGRGGRGMGSTAVALHLEGNNYEIAWVGDSRAYLWDGSSIVQLTRDHSYVQNLFDSGLISEEEALDHPQRNVISQALGAEVKEVRVDSVKGKLARGDRILLCSDGLTSELSDHEIASILNKKESCQAISDTLVKVAIESGGRDNITTILVEAPEDSPARVVRGATRPMNVIKEIGPIALQKNSAPLYGIAGFLLAALLIIVWFLMGQREEVVVPVGGGRGILGPMPVAMTKETKDTRRVQELLHDGSTADSQQNLVENPEISGRKEERNDRRDNR